jgi:arsenate reductase
MPDIKQKILFLCSANSCRSQMAEGWARALKRGSIEPHSAGIAAGGVNPRAAKVMAEAGAPIGDQRSKKVEDILHIPFDYVITVCAEADAVCPSFPGGARVVHVPFDDPPRLAKGAGSEEEALGHYRRVRDEIRAFVEKLPGSIPG